MKTSEEKIAETFFLVEANSFETLVLWRENEKEGEFIWTEESLGFWQTVGFLKKRPICISMFWTIIGGKRIAFYEGTSVLVDHDMIEKWLEETFHLSREKRCDAHNFHLCLDAIREINKKEIK